MRVSKTYIYRKPQRVRQWFKTKTVNSWKRTINGKNKRQLAWSERNKSMSINGDKSESWTKAATQFIGGQFNLVRLCAFCSLSEYSISSSLLNPDKHVTGYFSL